MLREQQQSGIKIKVISIYLLPKTPGLGDGANTIPRSPRLSTGGRKCVDNGYTEFVTVEKLRLSALAAAATFLRSIFAAKSAGVG